MIVRHKFFSIFNGFVNVVDRSEQEAEHFELKKQKQAYDWCKSKRGCKGLYAGRAQSLRRKNRWVVGQQTKQHNIVIKAKYIRKIEVLPPKPPNLICKAN